MVLTADDEWTEQRTENRASKTTVRKVVAGGWWWWILIDWAEQLPIDGRHGVGVFARVVSVVASQRLRLRLRQERGSGGGRRRVCGVCAICAVCAVCAVCGRAHMVRQRYLRHLTVQARRVIAPLVIVIVAVRVVVRCGRGSVQTDVYHNHAFSSFLATSF